MSHSESGLYYTSIRIYRKFVGDNFADIVASHKPSRVPINGEDLSKEVEQEVSVSDAIKEALLFAEAEVNEHLEGYYAVPVQPDNPYAIRSLRGYVHHIATIHLHGRSGVSKEFYFQYEQIQRNLKKYQTGEKKLIGVKPLANAAPKVVSKASNVGDEQWGAI